MRNRCVTVPILVALSLVLIMGTARAAKERTYTKIRFGVLPVLQALPIFVAQRKGFFAKAGLNVELVLFNAAADKDMAQASKSIDGSFGDLFTGVVLRGNGVDVRVVATNYDTRKSRRMFGVLGRPGGPYRSLKDLEGVPVAVSSGTVIDYVTEKLLVGGGVPRDQIRTMESKNIGLRFQMLLVGKLEAATLPEPLVTAAVKRGASLLADDSGLDASQTVLIFSNAFIEKHPDRLAAFLAAVDKAAKLTNSHPEAVRDVMVKDVRLPPKLKNTFPVPRFPAIHKPDRAVVDTVVSWLNKKGILRSRIGYGEIVYGD